MDRHSGGLRTRCSPSPAPSPCALAADLDEQDDRRPVPQQLSTTASRARFDLGVPAELHARRPFPSRTSSVYIDRLPGGDQDRELACRCGRRNVLRQLGFHQRHQVATFDHLHVQAQMVLGFRRRPAGACPTTRGRFSAPPASRHRRRWTRSGQVRRCSRPSYMTRLDSPPVAGVPGHAVHAGCGQVALLWTPGGTSGTTRSSSTRRTACRC